MPVRCQRERSAIAVAHFPRQPDQRLGGMLLPSLKLSKISKCPTPSSPLRSLLGLLRLSSSAVADGNGRGLVLLRQPLLLLQICSMCPILHLV